CTSCYVSLFLEGAPSTRYEWADFNVDAYPAAALKAIAHAFPGMRPILLLSACVGAAAVCCWSSVAVMLLLLC
ncbi:hypothetical protein Dimus_020616, partial [Dionaea muscipula]